MGNKLLSVSTSTQENYYHKRYYVFTIRCAVETPDFVGQKSFSVNYPDDESPDMYVNHAKNEFFKWVLNGMSLIEENNHDLQAIL